MRHRPVTEHPTARSPKLPAIAGLAVVVLLSAVIGPSPAFASSSMGPRAGRSAGLHSCCCGPACRVNCCCPTTDRVSAPAPADPADEDDEIDELLGDDSICKVGPLPCGGDPGASPSITPSRDRPALPASPVLASADRERPPLPRFVDRLTPRLPGDLPDEPPRLPLAGPLSPSPIA
jgi:hypothetical protein